MAGTRAVRRTVARRTQMRRQPEKNRPRPLPQLIDFLRLMKLSFSGRLALATLLVGALGLTSSCALAAQALSLPLRMVGKLLGAFASNPVGTAAAGAALL